MGVKLRARCNVCDKWRTFTWWGGPRPARCDDCLIGSVMTQVFKEPQAPDFVSLRERLERPTTYREDPRDVQITQLKHEISKLREGNGSLLAQTRTREETIKKRAWVAALWCWACAIVVSVVLTWKAAILFLFVWAMLTTMYLILKD